MKTFQHARASPSPRQEQRRQRTRLAIIAAGETLLTQRSPHGLTIDLVVEFADVAKGSFYNHFEDKQTLVREIYAIARADAERRVELANEGVQDPLSRLARALCVMVRFAIERQTRAQIMLSLDSGTMAEAPLNAGIVRDVSAGIAGGCFVESDLELAMLCVMGMVQIALIRTVEDSSRIPPAAMARSLAAAMLRSLGIEAERAKAIAASAADDLLAELRQ